MSDTQANADRLGVVLRYHQRTKHHIGRCYARSPGFMDWANQPDSFRRFEGAPRLCLVRPVDDPGPTYDALFDGSWAEQAPPKGVPLVRPRPTRSARFSITVSR